MLLYQIKILRPVFLCRLLLLSVSFVVCLCCMHFLALCLSKGRKKNPQMALGYIHYSFHKRAGLGGAQSSRTITTTNKGTRYFTLLWGAGEGNILSIFFFCWLSQLTGGFFSVVVSERGLIGGGWWMMVDVKLWI